MSNASPTRAAAVAEEAESEQSSGRLFVTFTVGEEVFAVDMAPVQEIIRVPETVRIPLAPAALDGLANLRGQVLPIISLARLFGFPERPLDDSSRAVVIDLGQPLGFVVDHVASVIEVEPERIDSAETVSSMAHSDVLAGLLKDVGGHPMIMLLDFARLVAREFSEIDQSVKAFASHALGGEREAEAEDEADADELQLVSFEVAGQEYAIAIDQVQEIVQVPEQIACIPQAARYVLGVMTLRNRLLPLVSLRTLFGLHGQAASERSRIVVVTNQGLAVGLVMDSVNEVLRVPREVVDPVPPLLARSGELADITHICRLERGKRLVSIIEAAHLFDHSVIKEAMQSMERAADETQVEDSLHDDEHDDEEQVVVFRLGAEEFGVPIASVQEIVRIPDELTHVPKAPAFVEGVINLRGSVLPVIDQRRRLGLADLERNDRQRIMVFLLGEIRTGFIVDAVSEVLKLPKHLIEPAPRLSAQQARLIARVANLEQQRRMILLIEPKRLLDDGDLDLLGGLDDA